MRVGEGRLVRARGAPGRFARLVPDDWGRLRRHGRAFKNGDEVDFPDLETALAVGASVYFKNVAWKLDAVRELCGAVREAAGAVSVQAALVLSRGAEHGYDLHQDPTALLVLQLRGAKRWTVYADGERDAVTWRGLLQDGDMLLVPEGWWHVAEARGESAHLTLSLVYGRISSAE